MQWVEHLKLTITSFSVYRQRPFVSFKYSDYFLGRSFERSSVEVSVSYTKDRIRSRHRDLERPPSRPVFIFRRIVGTRTRGRRGGYVERGYRRGLKKAMASATTGTIALEGSPQ